LKPAKRRCSSTKRRTNVREKQKAGSKKRENRRFIGEMPVINRDLPVRHRLQLVNLGVWVPTGGRKFSTGK
ncbi:hypothetical protein HAX54_043101, partial [Datura stramonium]|nr:hypothetical protein [Datura stramonium]